MSNNSQGQIKGVNLLTAKTRGTSPELTGGQGFTFEDAVSAVYAVSLLCESTAPGLPGREVTHIALQQGSFGQPLDDLVVKGVGVDCSSMTFSAQVKRKLVISAAKTNNDFRETIKQAYQTVVGTDFTHGLDRVGAVVGEIADASKRTFETLCEWARAESSSVDFSKKLRTDGAAGDKLIHFEAVRTILSEYISPEELDTAAYQLLRHFVLIRLDLLTEGSTTEASTVSLLKSALTPSDRMRADDLWRRLLALVRISQGRAAAFDRTTLVASLNGAFFLSGGPNLSKALKAIEQETRLAVAEIVNSISGLNVPRDGHVKAVIEATKTPGFVQIAGMPGAGKSVVLRSAIECLMESGPVLFLKSDRLQGTTWSQHASGSGIPHACLEELLVEFGAVGVGTLFIDGIDRIEVAHRGVVLDLLHTIHSSQHLSGWCVVATVRDTGMEPLRTWLPTKLFEGGIRTLTVNSFDDKEAKALAQARPALQSLLFGPKAIRTVVRRPFFAAILAKESVAVNTSANSEVDLATLWWERGGYAADSMRVGYRRSALVELAKAGAHQLGRRIPVSGIDGHVIAELEADGIIRSVRVGHSVQFVHDIFFEWAFLQYLVSEGEDWHLVLDRIGEPPALGRVVELLSQTELVHQDNWANYLAMLESDNTLRSQWLRSWMAGPFSLETFERHTFVFDQAMLATHARVAKLVVWYQAEKTQPNTKALERSDLPDFDTAQRMLYADMLGYPSDIAAWTRFCDWLLDHTADLATNIIPDVVVAFGVWQNAFSHYPNRVSERIVQTCLAWLYYIEHLQHRKGYSTDYCAWSSLERDEREQLEQSLIILVMNSSLTQRTLVAHYLRDLSRFEQIPHKVIRAVFLHAPILAKACPVDLVDFTLAVLKDRLPVDVKKSSRNQNYFVPHNFSLLDWNHLSIEDHFIFSSAAPTREPFHSLLKQAPDEGRRLIRELSNHAIRAWRQLHRLSYERKGTPVPIVLHFPWGKQVFWGDKQRYMGSRGFWGPSAVNSGLMALEAWAFEQLDDGTPVDEVLEKIIEGHNSNGALAIAVAISLQAKHCSEASLPIVTNQRIWHLDIQRQVQDLGPMANLMGFKQHEQDHAEAVRDSNARPVRRSDVRSLASLILIRGGRLGALVSAAIQGFPDELPFEYAQDRANEEVIAELSRTAQVWAEFGKLENYKTELGPDESQLIISLENPKTNTPDIEAKQSQHIEILRHLHILNWVYSYFEDNKLKDSLTIEVAVKAAKKLDAIDLFSTGYSSLDPNHQRQAVVAAVAAIVIAMEATKHLEWAVEVCVRASYTPEAFDGVFIRESKLMHHPVLFAARGLGAYFKLASEDDVAPLQSLLTELTAHPYEEITVAALQGLLSAWDKHPDVAWAALGLATRLALVEVRYELMPKDAEVYRQKYIHEVINTALQRITDGAPVEDTQLSFPAPWVSVTDPETTSARRGCDTEQSARWELNPTHVDVAFLQKVIDIIPVDAALADKLYASQFLNWCEKLAIWTIERISPSWVTDKRELKRNATDFYVWKSFFYRFLAKVSLGIPAEVGSRRFLAPAMATDDKTFSGLCDWFTSYLVTTIADSPKVPVVALSLLSTIAERTLEHRGWSNAAEGGSRLENEFIEIVRDLFFSKMPHANLSARFANGQWAEVCILIPIFDPILKAHGSVVFVASAWMNLCESSFEHYPVEHFVNNLEFLFGPDGRPRGWRNTQLPARLSGLIQRFSEQAQPMSASMAQQLLRALDRLVDMGDRRAAAVQLSEVFRSVRVANT